MPDHIWKNHAIRVKYIEGMWLSLMSRANLTLVIVVTYTASTHKCACFRMSSWPFSWAGVARSFSYRWGISKGIQSVEVHNPLHCGICIRNGHITEEKTQHPLPIFIWISVPHSKFHWK